MAAYCTNTQALDYVDARTWGDYLQDVGSRLDQGQVIASTKLTALLEAAAGEIEAACFRGGRYSADDLTGLTGNSLGLLKQLNAHLAFRNLVARRPNDAKDFKFIDQSIQLLSQIALGERIFNFDDVKTAHNSQTTTTSRLTVLESGYLRDYIQFLPARRFPC